MRLPCDFGNDESLTWVWYLIVWTFYVWS